LSEVTSPLAGDRLEFEAATSGGANLRRRRPAPTAGGGLLTARLRRALRRQWPLFLIIVVLIAAAGAAFDYFGGIRILASLPGWLAIGAAVAFAIVGVRELSRNAVTSPASLGKHRGYAVLGAAPELTPRALRELAPDQRTPLGCVTFQPASAFATAFRNLQGALSADGAVAFIGGIPGEGATTAALCTALSAQQQGRRVIILDCDLRHRVLTKTLGRDPNEGIFEAVTEPRRWRELVDHEDETGLPFIPAARHRNPWRNIHESRGFAALLDGLSTEYDLVIMDCPPALMTPDGPMTARVADRCVLVAVWDRTRVKMIRDAMRAIRVRARGATGVYINRVPPGYRFGRLRGD